MNITNLEVLKGLVARKKPNMPQLIQVSATTRDIYSHTVELKWHNVLSDGTIDGPFASANICYGDAAEWLQSWVPITHLVQGRIQGLERMAEEGIATRFSHNMAYQLFANNLVNYSKKYRGMTSVVLHEFETFADVVLSTETSGTWTVPPFFIDSVAHLAGFTMNVSNAVDTKENFCVTPGWSSMRFARPLVAGGKYRSYTKMIPTLNDSSIYTGDVYIFQGDMIMGMVGGIKFRRYPRILLNRFFSAPDEGVTEAHGTAPAPPSKPAQVTAQPEVVEAKPVALLTKATPELPPTSASQVVIPSSINMTQAPNANSSRDASSQSDTTATKAMRLIAKEAALELTALVNEASFTSLGVDSLMSLVIAEKFREELGITVGGSLFLEYPTISDLRAWLEEYYN
jgi:iterative type I PKS product template protein